MFARCPPIRLLCLILGLLAIAASSVAETVYTGRVMAVHDGDTLALRTPDGDVLRIRLAEIDAPELAQHYGPQARRSLAHLTLHKTARVVEKTRDHYGRIVGRVYVSNLDISAEMLRLGLAWSYRQYAKDRSLFPIEQQARQARRGLWADTEPLPPWIFRHSQTPTPEWRTTVVHRCRRPDGSVSYSEKACAGEDEIQRIELTPRPQQGASTGAANPSSPYPRLCRRRPRCEELRDCDEARFYFVVCGLDYLDHNGDGTPCENLCR
ncbi:MAG: thermonuclease family protein [Gammaproteobacteria bacterium]|nr:thermonuclease family protein [Gammaproteobacteria bacterium]